MHVQVDCQFVQFHLTIFETKGIIRKPGEGLFKEGKSPSLEWITYLEASCGSIL